MNESLERKLDDLRGRIRKLDSAIVAFSGGVDSSLLMRVCREELGDRAVAVTAFTGDYPSAELGLARRIAKIMGAKHVIHKIEKRPDSAGPICKGKVYSSLKSLAARLKMKNVIDGSHTDDASEKGFSFIAARAAGVKSPLLEVGLSKAEIRLLAKELGLPNWDQDSSGPLTNGDTPFTDLHSGSGFKKMQAAKRYLASSFKITGAKLFKSGKKLRIILGKRDFIKLAKKIDAVKKKIYAIGFSDVLLCLSSKKCI